MCINVNIYLFKVYFLSVCSKQSIAGYTKVSEMRNGLLHAEVSSRKANSKAWAWFHPSPNPALGKTHLRLHLPGNSLPLHEAKSSHLLLQPPVLLAPKAVSDPLAMLSFPTFSWLYPEPEKARAVFILCALRAQHRDTWEICWLELNRKL